MRFLFIGASGFVGQHAMALAADMGHEVAGTQSRAKGTGLIKFDLLEDRIADCLPSEFTDAADPAFGIVCASVRQIDECYERRDVTHKINVEGTIQLIHDLLDQGLRPVFLSTSYVYDGVKGYYSEDDEHCPCCEYGRHKAEVEKHLTEHLPEVLVLRLDKIVGDDPAEDHLFTEWGKWVQTSRPLTCIAGQLLSPTFVEDIGRAIITACQKDLKGLYNTANPEFFSREELAYQFLAVLGKDIEVVLRPQSDFSFKDARPLKTYLDSSRFLQETGFLFTPMSQVMRTFAAKM